MQTLEAVYRTAAQTLDRVDARWIICHLCKVSHAELLTQGNRSVSASEFRRISQWVARRKNGEPLAYLLGEAGFYGRIFKVSPAVLIPRPETEDLVSHALKWIAQTESPRILDLGTGSGAIAITLALERPDARVLGTDISMDALMVARSNAARLNAKVHWRQGDWFKALRGHPRFDLIVSNPPYIAANDPHLSGDGVCVEPQLALTDGGDGLNCLRLLTAGAGSFLSKGGGLLLEHGYDQGQACRSLLEEAGFINAFTHQDLAGHDRISGGRLSPQF